MGSSNNGQLRQPAAQTTGGSKGGRLTGRPAHRAAGSQGGRLTGRTQRGIAISAGGRLGLSTHHLAKLGGIVAALRFDVWLFESLLAKPCDVRVERRAALEP